MDLNLTDEQHEIVSAVRSFLTDRSPSDVVRASEPGGFDAGLWEAFCAMAGPTIGVPEKLGGGGASLLDLELVCEQIGSFLAPVPFIEASVACRALASSGDPGLTGLDALLGEPTRVATVALRPAVDGTARLVPFGPVARTVVGMDGDDLVVVDADGDGSGPPTSDRRPWATGRCGAPAVRCSPRGRWPVRPTPSPSTSGAR